MKHLGRVAGYNVLAILAYSSLLRLILGGGGYGEDGLPLLVASAFAVGFHVFVCLVMSAFLFLRDKKPLAKAWLLSAGIVLVVGFSTCWGNAMF